MNAFDIRPISEDAFKAESSIELIEPTLTANGIVLKRAKVDAEQKAKHSSPEDLNMNDRQPSHLSQYPR